MPAALLSYQRAYQLDPAMLAASSNAIYTKFFLCDWRNRSAEIAEYTLKLQQELLEHDLTRMPSMQVFDLNQTL